VTVCKNHREQRMRLLKLLKLCSLFVLKSLSTYVFTDLSGSETSLGGREP